MNILKTNKTNKMEKTELSTKDKVLQLIENLKNDPEYNTVDVYESEMPEWEYFFRLRGFLGARYFHVEISKMKEYPDSHNIYIANSIDCKEEINEKLKQFKLL